MLAAHPSDKAGLPDRQAGGWTNMFITRLRPEMKELYGFSLLYSFAFALITILEPVFFYKEGFSLSFIALYYALHYTVYAGVLPLGGKFASRFGLERSLTLSLPLFVAYFLVLAAVPSNHDLIWLAIVFLTCQKIFYWPAFHTSLAKFGQSGNRGTELSWLRVLSFAGTILGPLIGGFVARYFGFPVLFIFTAVVVLFSAIPLLKTKEKYRPGHFSYLDPWKIIISRQYRNMTVAMAGMGEDLINLVYWPIFLFIVLGSTDRLGLISSLTIAVMTLMSFFVGELSDRFPRQYILRLHIPFLVLSHLFRPLTATPIQAVLTDMLAKVSYTGVNIPMLYRLYVQGQRAGLLRYMVAFETVLAIAKALTAFMLVVVFAVLLPYPAFMFTFAAAAVLALLYAFL